MPLPRVRPLLPALINLAIVGVMIARGIGQSRERYRTEGNRLGQANDVIRSFCQAAAQFLATRQASDGSWDDGGAGASFARAGQPGRVAPTMRVLLGVRASGYAGEPFYRRGLGFVRRHQERLRGWLHGDRGGDPGDLEPTVDALAMGSLLLGPEPDGGAELRSILRAQQTPRGLYRHGLGPPGAAAGRRVLVGDNVLLLGVLPALGMDTTELAAAIRSELDEVPPAPPKTWIVLAYLGSLAAPTGGAEAHALVARLLDRLEPSRLGPVAALDDVALSAYLRVRADQCLRDADACNDLNAAVAALLGRRQGDGSWRAPAVAAVDGGGIEPSSTGSAVETTALALDGLATYRRILDGRAKGMLGAYPADAAGAVLRR